MASSKKKSIRYADAGVSIDEGNKAVASIRNLARATFTKGVRTDIGSFGAGFRLSGYKKPVLISSADGVGTKLKLAFETKRHDTIGECLVNHCVNDIMVQGAEPLYFLDYFATGKLEAGVAAQVVSGLARGCKANGCALIGGETAEMPGFYQPGEYDIAGFITGVVEEADMIAGQRVKAGDLLLGLESNGLHTNGYSLARHVLFAAAGMKVSAKPKELGGLSLGEELLKVHRSYAEPLRKLKKAGLLHGAAHITGGGITENTPRMLPAGLHAAIHRNSFPVQPIFQLLREAGNIPEDDWRRTFNLGIGMIVAIPAAKAKKAAKLLEKLKLAHWVLGEVVKGKRGEESRVQYVD
jgi:phosphoribosylformylglycinamidine cyclo-ligase